MSESTIKRLINNPWRIFNSFARRGWLNRMPDKLYLSLIYRAAFGKKLDWEKPKTFNEKLQWLKLNDRKDEYTKMVDKYEAKQLVTNYIGEKYIVPVVGGPWKNFDDIDFNVLPDQFVLKTTHDCGGVVICKNKAEFDKSYAKRFIDRHLQRNYYLTCREWPYKNIEPKIFAEKYISDENNFILPVYKIFCFNGLPKIIQAIQNDKQKDETIDYFDIHWNNLKLKQNFPNSKKIPQHPKNLENMVNIARELSKGHAFLRIDLYEANGNIYFSEYTFYSDAGLAKFEPAEWDEILGSWIKLPIDD